MTDEIKIIDQTNGDGVGEIDKLISFLIQAHKGGATHYQMEWSKDPEWAFKWFKAFRYRTQEEIDEIKELEEKLRKLKE